MKKPNTKYPRYFDRGPDHAARFYAVFKRGAVPFFIFNSRWEDSMSHPREKLIAKNSKPITLAQLKRRFPFPIPAR